MQHPAEACFTQLHASLGVGVPETSGYPALAARWGYPGQKGVTMPGPGKTTTGTRGEGFLDIHLNATTRWKDVPIEAWNYILGGYQVLKSGSATASKPSSTAPSPPTRPNHSPTTPAASPPSSRRAVAGWALEDGCVSHSASYAVS